MIVNIRIRLQKGPATRGLARSHAHFTLSARPMSRVALDVARAGADEGEENAGACGRRGEGDGGGAGARHAPLLPMKFGCSSTLMLAAVLVTVHQGGKEKGKRLAGCTAAAKQACQGATSPPPASSVTLHVQSPEPVQADPPPPNAVLSSSRRPPHSFCSCGAYFCRAEAEKFEGR